MELNPKEFQGFHLALLNKVRLECYKCFLRMRSLSYSVMITDIDIACTKLQSLGQFFNSRALLCLNLTFCSDFSAKRPPEASIQMFYVICLGA